MKNVQVVPALSTFFNDEALVKNSLSINKNARKKKKTQTKTWDVKLRLNIWSRIDLHACGKKQNRNMSILLSFSNWFIISLFVLKSKINSPTNHPDEYMIQYK